MAFAVATLYHFFAFSQFANWRVPFKAKMERLGVKGILPLTPEGMNGT